MAATFAFAQTTAPDTTFRSTSYEQKRTLFESLPNTKKEIIFLGNSISDFGEWAELFDDPHVKNRGISGDLSFGVLARLGEVTASKPAKIFLLIGINDLADSAGKLDARYTNDGLHLVGAGYIQWVKALRELGHMK
ncbi:hypothetical protein HU175_19850 [Spirosoma sp. KUDC1026]|nr:hypothetical protein HU175_19850 [Spirosoma sp. KUDC1026]